MTWWQWAGLWVLACVAHYIWKIQQLLGQILFILAHQDPKNPAAESFLEDHRERIREQFQHPFTWQLRRWWRE